MIGFQNAWQVPGKTVGGISDSFFKREGFKMLKRILLLLVAGVIMAGLIGCEKKGTAEKAGQKIDEAAESAKKALEDLKK